jgi:cytochrome c oxidase subunit II
VAQIAALVSLVASACVLAVAIFVASRSRQAVADGNAPVYRVRKYYFVALVAGLAGTLAFTLPRAPYGAYAAVEPAIHVQVTGIMWAWQIHSAGVESAGPLVLPSGKVVEFDVTGGDVNHGFGVYDDEGRLLGQTQAMPGYVNHLRLVFDTPGRYHVLCLEFCGMAHHIMIAEFTVQ